MKIEKDENGVRIKPNEMVEGAESLSLGISMVVAVLLGVALGYGLKTIFDVPWLMWIGVGIGVAGALLNVFKAYSSQYKMYEELGKQDRYKIKKQLEDGDDWEEDEKY